jgi:putative sigma-54 modulation protein
VQLSVTGRHIDITEAMRQYAEEKAGKLTRYYDRVESIDVVFDYESSQRRVEMVVRTDHKSTFVAQVEASDYYEAIDLVSDKMGRQLIKHKEKFRNRKHPDRHESGQEG